MNANEISIKADSRLSQIRKTSRALKVLLLLYFGTHLYLPFVQKMPDGFWIVWGTYTTFAEAPFGAKLIVALGAGILLVVVITAYQLLNLYEKGIIFSPRNAKLLGRIGSLTFGYGLLGVCGPALMSTWFGWVGGTGSLLSTVLLSSLSFLSSPWVVGGLFGIVISYIMAEGQKIQEEQELTV